MTWLCLRCYNLVKHRGRLDLHTVLPEPDTAGKKSDCCEEVGFTLFAFADIGTLLPPTRTEASTK